MLGKYMIDSMPLLLKPFTLSFSSSSSAAFYHLVEKVSPKQSKEFNDDLILVNNKDKQIGSISKIKAHLLSENNTNPHRAFSVFLFNARNELLLQQRSKTKVTFPMMWSNTCCSHPLNITSENCTKNNNGIKTAIQRRMKFELGINSLPKDYFFNGKIQYRAKSNKVFEEFEVDYLFLMKNNTYTEELLRKVINYDEVNDIKFMSQEELLKDMKEKQSEYYTPWFKMIMTKKGKELFDFFPMKRHGKVDKRNANKIISFV